MPTKLKASAKVSETMNLELVAHDSLGDVFLIQVASSEDRPIFDVDGEGLTLRVSKDTMLKLSQTAKKILEFDQ